MLTLGVCEGPNGSAALVDGEHVIAVEEQARHERATFSTQFPWSAIEAVLASGHVRASEIERVAIAGRISPPLFLRRLPGLRSWLRPKPNSWTFRAMTTYQSLVSWSGVGALQEDVASSWFERTFAARGLAPGSVRMVDAHHALATAAYVSQSETQATILTLHPNGDGVFVSVFRAQDGMLQCVHRQGGAARLHTFQRQFIAGCGLHPWRDEHQFWMSALHGETCSSLHDALWHYIGSDSLRILGSRRRPDWLPLLADVRPENAAATFLGVIARYVKQILATVEGVDDALPLVLGGSLVQHPAMSAALFEALGACWVAPDNHRASLALGAAGVASGLAPRAENTPGYGGLPDPARIQRAMEAARVSSTASANTVERAIHVLNSGGSLGLFLGRGGFHRQGNGTRSVLLRADRPEETRQVVERLGGVHDLPVSMLVLPEAGERCGLSRYGHLSHRRMVAVEPPSAFLSKYGGAQRSAKMVLMRQLGADTDPVLFRILTAVHEETGCESFYCLPLAEGHAEPVSLAGDALRVWQRANLDGLMLGEQWLERT